MKSIIFLATALLGLQAFAAGSLIDTTARHLVSAGYCIGPVQCTQSSIASCIRQASGSVALESIEENHRAFIITEILASNNCINHSNLSSLEDNILASFSRSTD